MLKLELENKNNVSDYTLFCRQTIIPLILSLEDRRPKTEEVKELAFSGSLELRKATSNVPNILAKGILFSDFKIFSIVNLLSSLASIFSQSVKQFILATTLIR
jgi:hypothetical protein